MINHLKMGTLRNKDVAQLTGDFMNIDEQTYKKFQQLYQAEPIIDVDMFFAKNFMEFVELLEPYATEEASMNELTKYMIDRDTKMYDVFMHCILSLGIRASK